MLQHLNFLLYCDGFNKNFGECCLQKISAVCISQKAPKFRKKIILHNTEIHKPNGHVTLTYASNLRGHLFLHLDEIERKLIFLDISSKGFACSTIDKTAAGCGTRGGNKDRRSRVPLFVPLSRFMGQGIILMSRCSAIHVTLGWSWADLKKFHQQEKIGLQSFKVWNPIVQ